MKYGKSLTLVAAGLVAGLVVGSFGIAMAATPAATRAGQAAGVAGYGLRIGVAMRDAGARMIDQVAKLTGLSVTDVAARRASGTSYAAIAAAKGVSADALVAKAIAARKTVLDGYVKSGRITAEQEKVMLATMGANMRTRVQSTDPAACDGTGTGAGGGQGGGMGRGRGAGIHAPGTGR
jgi:hypothetical protein